MNLSLEEKQRLYEKAQRLYNSIKQIKIRKEIDVDIPTKYYDSNSRYANWGFKYYFKGSMNIFGNDIEDSLKDLKNYIDFKNGVGEQYINGKSVAFLSNYTTNALLDFIYYGDKIKTSVEKQNNVERQELNDLLS